MSLINYIVYYYSSDPVDGLPFFIVLAENEEAASQKTLEMLADIFGVEYSGINDGHVTGLNEETAHIDAIFSASDEELSVIKTVFNIQ